jgi:hypothetical protein
MGLFQQPVNFSWRSKKYYPPPEELKRLPTESQLIIANEINDLMKWLGLKMRFIAGLPWGKSVL